MPLSLANSDSISQIAFRSTRLILPSWLLDHFFITALTSAICASTYVTSSYKNASTAFPLSMSISSGVKVCLSVIILIALSRSDTYSFTTTNEAFTFQGMFKDEQSLSHILFTISPRFRSILFRL